MATAPLPSPRGPVTEWLLAHLRKAPHDVGPPPTGDDPLAGDDTQLALHLCYELHYRGLDRVDDGWEWDPSLLRARQAIEAGFVDLLPRPEPVADVVVALEELVTPTGGPSVSQHMAEVGTLAQLRELAVHRSAYQLKEADPHTWAIPRLAGRAKAAMVRVQADEYGDGVASHMHSALFADTMRALGLDATYGHYLDVLPGVTLATGNLLSYLGLHRAHRGACAGHLAVFEMTSVEPMGRYAAACQRLGLHPDARHFYDVHVAADAVHRTIALHDMVASLVADEPGLGPDVVWGARCLMDVEARLSEHVMDAWAGGRSSLLDGRMLSTPVAA